MSKNKIKLSLIDDYIKITIIKNFLNNSFPYGKNCVELMQLTQNLDKTLKIVYEKLFDDLNLNDSSFCVLKKELELNNSLFLNAKQNNFLNLESILKQSYNDLNNILNNLKEKTRCLKITIPAEIFC